MITLAMGVLALLQDLGDNPEYKGWAEFKGGSTVTHKMVLNGKPQEGLRRMTLKSVKDDKVVVDVLNTIQAMGAPRLGEQEIPAKIAGVLKPEKEGEEEIEAGGKKLKCRWGEITKKAPNGKSEVVRYWLHDEVPGKMVQTKVTYEGGVTAILTASEWKKND